MLRLLGEWVEISVSKSFFLSFSPVSGKSFFAQVMKMYEENAKFVQALS